MSQQKLTIALIGEDEARKHAKPKILNFSRTYNSQNKSETFKPNNTANNTAKNSSSILEGFLFEGYEVDIIEVTRLDEGLPKFDGAILTHIHVTHAPSETVTYFNHVHEDPYFCLAEKIGGTGNALQKFDLYQRLVTHGDVPSEFQEFNIIKSFLTQFIRVKDLRSIFKNDNETKLEEIAEDIILPWYKRSRLWVSSVVSLGAIIVVLLIGAIWFATGALTGFALTPLLIALAITLLVYGGVLISIKIAYDNRLRMSVSSIPDSPTITSSDLSINEQVQQTFDPSYSSVVQTNQDLRGSNLQFANDAAAKLRTMLANNNESNKRSQVKIIFSLEDNGQFFINCSNSNPCCAEAQEEFEKFEKTLKGSLGNEIALDHIPITKILDLPDEAANQLETSNNPNL